MAQNENKIKKKGQTTKNRTWERKRGVGPNSKGPNSSQNPERKAGVGSSRG